MALQLKLKPPPPCEECGYDPAYHRLERLNVVLDSALDRFGRPIAYIAELVVPAFESVFDRIGPHVAKALSRVGLITTVETPDARSSETAMCLWKEAEQRGIVMREARLLGLPRRLFWAEFGSRTIAFEGLPRPPRIQRSLNWIDNKAEIKKRFQAAGFPVARGGASKSEEEALAWFRRLEAPVVIKPHIGSGGRHTHVHIESEEDVRRAFRSAARLSPLVLIEEELRGPVFRATLVGGKLVAVLRREPPAVVGDGRRTVRELVEGENKNPLRRGPVFAEISLDDPALNAELVQQGLTKESVPSAGKTVLLHFKVNWGVGGTSRDATDEVHSENVHLFVSVGQYLGDDIIGIDFMIPDIGRPWEEQERCGIIECNSLPLIGNHHFPFTGPVRNVAGSVWDLVFPESGGR